MNIMWAPGQSDATRDIIRHLNGREKSRLAGLNILLAFCAFAIPLILMGSTMGIGPVQVQLGVMVLPVLGVLALGLWLSVTLQWRLLLGTQVAKDRGFTRADLKVRHSFSRGEYLAVGGIAALAVIVGVAGFLMAA